MVKRQKIEAMAIKRRKDRGEIILFSREKENHESETKDDTDPDQAKDKYQLQIWVVIEEKL